MEIKRVEANHLQALDCERIRIIGKKKQLVVAGINTIATTI